MCVFGARRWVRITDEATWGTYNGAATGAAIQWLRMHEDNAFVASATPNTYDVRSYEALNQLILRGSANIAVSFTLNTLMYHSQVAKWFDWAWGLVGAGNPAVYSLPSKTIDFADPRGSFRITGARVTQMTLTGSAAAQSAPFRVQIQGIGQKLEKLGAPIAEPLLTVYPPVNTHYKFQHSKGGFKLGAGATARTEYDAFQGSWTNILQPKFFEDTWISCLQWCGRDTGFTTGFATGTSQFWDDYQALQEQANASIELNNGGNKVLMDWKSKGQLTSYDPSFPIGDIAMESLGLTGIFDPGASGGAASFGYTVTDAP